MTTYSPYPRILAAGGCAILMTACLAFIMQALVMQDDVVLQEEVPTFSPDILMKDEDPEVRRVGRRQSCSRRSSQCRPWYQSTLQIQIRARSSFLKQAARGRQLETRFLAG